MIISQVGIAGSVEVGNNTTLAGQVGVAGHLKIGNNVVIAAKSGVAGNVADNQILSGYPLMDHREDLKVRVLWKNYQTNKRIIEKLEKKLQEK